jgi:hypothetical protein
MIKRTLGITLSIISIILNNPMLGYALLENGTGHAYMSYPTYNYNFFEYKYSYVLTTPVDILPGDYATVIVGEVTYYYRDGIFYQKDIKEQKYIVVPPPIGGVVYSIPPGYRMIIVDGVAYYQYNGIFYKRVLEGYKIVEPPASLI